MPWSLVIQIRTVTVFISLAPKYSNGEHLRAPVSYIVGPWELGRDTIKMICGQSDTKSRPQLALECTWARQNQWDIRLHLNKKTLRGPRQYVTSCFCWALFRYDGTLRVSILGIVAMVWGRYLTVGSLDPQL